ncbi:substrate-binding domain-containing protein [Angustibacter sp. McL0619]|uniref:substrate-binding domain-containing protein n=1 Tax=Angustibacter sp. McL0619 TaxID=3415676 RepID=UPI003CF36FBB
MTTDTLTRAQLRSRHRARKSRHRARTVAGLATLLIIVVGTSGLAWWGYQARGAASCGASPVILRVAASSSVADEVVEEARAFERGKPQVGDACVTVDVTAMDVPKVNEALVSAAALRRDPGFDVWIPESATWAKVLSRRPEVDRLLPDVFSVLASSPVVAAIPEPMAKALGWPKRQAELDDLVALAQDPAGWARFGHPEWGRVRVAWPDPQKSTAGLDGLMTLFAKLDTGNAEQLRGGMLRVQNALTSLNLDDSKAVASLSDAQLTPAQALKQSMITPSTEREVRAFNAANPVEKLAPVTVGVSGASSKVGYLPLYGTSLDRVRAMTAAESFGQFLTSQDGSRAFARAGWRIPTGESGTETGPATVGSGASVHEVKLATLELSQPTLQSITRALQSWSALERTGSVLLAVDVSGSMKEQVPRLGLTRLELAQKALTSAIVSTSDRSSIGLWEFSRRLKGDKDYQVVVPLGAASDAVGAGTRRDAVRVGIGRLTARGDTGLYDTTLAAVRDVRSKWRADQDVVVILSDGKNEDPGSISLKGLVAALKKEQDPDRPVRVYTVAYGAQADAAALSAIAKATGGQSFVAASPADIERVLLASLSE